MRPTFRSALLAAVLSLPLVANAIEFLSVKEPAILYETPSVQGKKLFIISPGTPVEVVVELDQWVKVREAGGAISWIAREALSPQRTVLVTAASAALKERPAGDAPTALEAASGVVLDMVSPPERGWVQVRHRDGGAGYVRVTDVWGL